ncbi:MAG: FCD domain-containing protein [Inquilinaceae bacterium]
MARQGQDDGTAAVTTITGIDLAEGETLAQAAYRALRVDIIRGVRAPGERLRIEKLKTLYRVGPTPLREALQKLSVDRLVMTEGNRGFTVAALDVKEFDDLNIARTAIEKEALRLSLANGGDDWEARVVAASYLMRKEDAALLSARDRVPDSWERANEAFHTAMVSACGSTWLLRARASLHDLCERYRRASVYQKLGARDLGGEHQAIAEAVLARDTERACMLTARHYALTATSLAEAGDQAARLARAGA